MALYMHYIKDKRNEESGKKNIPEKIHLFLIPSQMYSLQKERKMQHQEV